MITQSEIELNAKEIIESYRFLNKSMPSRPKGGRRPRITPDSVLMAYAMVKLRISELELNTSNTSSSELKNYYNRVLECIELYK